MLNAANLIVCPDCDLVCRRNSIEKGVQASCPRCNAAIGRESRWSLEAASALALTEVMLNAVFNFFPLLTLDLNGTARSSTLLGAAVQMWNHEMRLISVLVVTTTIVVPTLQISARLYIVWHVASMRHWGGLDVLLRLMRVVRPWSMVEVFLLGLLVSMVKLQSVADIIVGPALWACACLIVVMAALASAFDAHNVWVWTQETSRNG
jgi:paraquat-inducible protein A